MDVTTTLPAFDLGEFRVLALSGGVPLGVYTVEILVELEARVGAPLGRRFDLIADTSAGWILAAALGYGFRGKRKVEKHHAC